MVGQSVSLLKYFFSVYSIPFQGNFSYSVSNVLQFLAILVSYEDKSGYIGGLWRPVSQIWYLVASHPLRIYAGQARKYGRTQSMP